MSGWRMPSDSSSLSRDGTDEEVAGRVARHAAPLYVSLLLVNLAISTLEPWIAPAPGPMVAVLALILAGLVVARPLDEVPLALLVAGTLGRDEPLFLVLAAAAARVVLSPDTAIVRSARGLALLLVAACATSSALLGYLLVEFRPLQTILWALTFGAWLVVAAASGTRPASPGSARLFLALLCLAIAGQVVPLAVQLVLEGSMVPGDWATGTWGNANFLGFWATVAAASIAITITGFSARWSRASLAGLATLFAIACVLAFFAEAKIYSTAVLAAGLVVLTLAVVRELAYNRISALFKLIVLVVGGIGALVAAAEQLRAVAVRMEPSVEVSRKLIFLRRVFSEEPDNISALLGAGPGTAGSRAANAVAVDVMYKEEVNVPAAIAGSTVAQRWAMSGLWDEELFTQIRYLSSILVMPFSGIGSVKAEMGYVGLVAIVAMLLIAGAGSLGRAFAPDGARGRRFVAVFAAVGTLATLPLALFDNVWEMPRITALLASALLALGLGLFGVDASRDAARPPRGQDDAPFEPSTA